ncbi:hypothetical protein Glove_465g45 [Diversispora epigaea]|uniref:Sphingomyelin synthase-like domain-containing protein n=1 Tax=Diversispora epigaea TaxID=1348612 RepID=A0A397GM09_9GLOM|nr:hypothetical protein Glove_465g45 [Diversispora epigaea]
MIKNGVDLITGSAKACTDNIFSGHSIFITTSVILLRVYCRYKFIVYYSYLHAFVALCLLVATRIHYTVDVILAIFITYAAHSIYFFIVDLCIEKHFLDINRAEDRLGDKDLYQRIAYMPNMFNISLVGAVRWMDGLDIRFTCEGEEILDATRERARRRRLQNSSDASSNSEMTEVEIMVNPSQDDVEGLLKSTEDYYNSYLPFQKLYNTTPSILNSPSLLALISHASFAFLLLYTFTFLGLAIMWSTFSVPITSFYNNNNI